MQSGKTRSFKNLNWDESFVIRPNRKPFSFPGARKLKPWDSAEKKGHYIYLDDYKSINSVLEKLPEYGKKVIIIDDSTHLLLKQTMDTGHQSPALKLHFNNNIQTFPITTAKVSIGRNPGNDIQIDDQTVSGSHAYIQFQEGAFYIFDNQSTNGTFVNQKKITEYKLNPNDQIKLGSAVIEFILI